MAQPKISYEITRQKVSEGIRLCIDRAQTFVEDAERLVKADGSLNNAGVLYIYGPEEYGKALLLRDALEKATGDTIAVLLKILQRKRAHNLKLNRAYDTLPHECLGLSGETGFDFRSFSRRGFQVGLPLGLETRLDALYADWVHPAKHWKKAGGAQP